MLGLEKYFKNINIITFEYFINNKFDGFMVEKMIQK